MFSKNRKHIWLAAVVLVCIALAFIGYSLTTIENDIHQYESKEVVLEGWRIKSKLHGDYHYDGKNQVLGNPYELMLWVDPPRDQVGSIRIELDRIEFSDGATMDLTKALPMRVTQGNDGNYFFSFGEFAMVSPADCRLLFSIVYFDEASQTEVFVPCDIAFTYSFDTYKSNKIIDAIQSA